ncbi:MAG: hypothetical protein RIS34_2453 [Pseudomonadota bacterium]
MSAFVPTGTVYGTLLNFRGEVNAMTAQMTQPPYKAAPQAPVLYVKTANTWTPWQDGGAPITLPHRVPEVEVGATIAMVIGPPAPVDIAQVAPVFIAGYVLMNDLSIPHTSFFRPPIKYKCIDGFLGIGPALVPARPAGDPALFRLEVRINGALRQTIAFADLVRPVAQLLADVNEFMTLQPGDVLMLGCDAGRPLARVGDRIDISAPGLPALGTLSNLLVGAITT